MSAGGGLCVPLVCRCAAIYGILCIIINPFCYSHYKSWLVKSYFNWRYYYGSPSIKHVSFTSFARQKLLKLQVGLPSCIFVEIMGDYDEATIGDVSVIRQDSLEWFFSKHTDRSWRLFNEMRYLILQIVDRAFGHERGCSAKQAAIPDMTNEIYLLCTPKILSIICSQRSYLSFTHCTCTIKIEICI